MPDEKNIQNKSDNKDKLEAQQKPPNKLTEEAVAEPEHSRLYKAVSQVFFLFLLLSLAVTSIAGLFVLDFLDIWQFRYKIPKPWRKVWPLTKYYDFVQLYQLPDEERYQELMLREKARYDKEITQGSRDLKSRAKELDTSYRTLVRMQKEKFDKAMKDLREKQEEFLKEKAKFDNEKKDIKIRKEAVDTLSKQLASETKNLESSLIRFMEKANKMKQVQTIASAMDPGGLAKILDEVTDNKMIYNILRGMPPIKSGKVLALMDPEKAGKILKMGEIPVKLPPPGPAHSYVPPSLQNLVASTQALLR